MSSETKLETLLTEAERVIDDLNARMDDLATGGYDSNTVATNLQAELDDYRAMVAAEVACLFMPLVGLAPTMVSGPVIRSQMDLDNFGKFSGMWDSAHINGERKLFFFNVDTSAGPLELDLQVVQDKLSLFLADTLMYTFVFVDFASTFSVNPLTVHMDKVAVLDEAFFLSGGDSTDRSVVTFNEDGMSGGIIVSKYTRGLFPTDAVNPVVGLALKNLPLETSYSRPYKVQTLLTNGPSPEDYVMFELNDDGSTTVTGALTKGVQAGILPKKTGAEYPELVSLRGSPVSAIVSGTPRNANMEIITTPDRNTYNVENTVQSVSLALSATVYRVTDVTTVEGQGGVVYVLTTYINDINDPRVRLSIMPYDLVTQSIVGNSFDIEFNTIQPTVSYAETAIYRVVEAGFSDTDTGTTRLHVVMGKENGDLLRYSTMAFDIVLTANAPSSYTNIVGVQTFVEDSLLLGVTQRLYSTDPKNFIVEVTAEDLSFSKMLSHLGDVGRADDSLGNYFDRAAYSDTFHVVDGEGRMAIEPSYMKGKASSLETPGVLYYLSDYGDQDWLRLTRATTRKSSDYQVDPDSETGNDPLFIRNIYTDYDSPARTALGKFVASDSSDVFAIIRDDSGDGIVYRRTPDATTNYANYTPFILPMQGIQDIIFTSRDSTTAGDIGIVVVTKDDVASDVTELHFGVVRGSYNAADSDLIDGVADFIHIDDVVTIQGSYFLSRLRESDVNAQVLATAEVSDLSVDINFYEPVSPSGKYDFLVTF